MAQSLSYYTHGVNSYKLLAHVNCLMGVVHTTCRTTMLIAMYFGVSCLCPSRCDLKIYLSFTFRCSICPSRCDLKIYLRVCGPHGFPHPYARSLMYLQVLSLVIVGYHIDQQCLSPRGYRPGRFTLYPCRSQNTKSYRIILPEIPYPNHDSSHLPICATGTPYKKGLPQLASYLAS